MESNLSSGVRMHSEATMIKRAQSGQRETQRGGEASAQAPGSEGSRMRFRPAEGGLLFSCARGSPPGDKPPSLQCPAKRHIPGGSELDASQLQMYRKNTEAVFIVLG